MRTPIVVVLIVSLGLMACTTTERTYNPPFQKAEKHKIPNRATPVGSYVEANIHKLADGDLQYDYVGQYITFEANFGALVSCLSRRDSRAGLRCVFVFSEGKNVTLAFFGSERERLEKLVMMARGTPVRVYGYFPNFEYVSSEVDGGMEMELPMMLTIRIDPL